jgi:hypothetical protein
MIHKTSINDYLKKINIISKEARSFITFARGVSPQQSHRSSSRSHEATSIACGNLGIKP